MLRKEQLQAIKDCPTTPDCIACIFYEKHGCSSGRPEDLAETALELMAEVEQLQEALKQAREALEHGAEDLENCYARYTKNTIRMRDAIDAIDKLGGGK